MPTIPSSGGPPEPHQARQMAESFGVDPKRYDRARSRYPRELIERIVATSPGRDVLDVGCGTGIAARQLQAAECRVLGIDIDPRMAEFARGRGLEVEVANFENWDPSGRTFDAVVAAQTWHWIDPVAGATKARQLLRPGGLIAIFRNDPRLPAELEESFAEVYDRVLPDLPLNPHRQRAQPSHRPDSLSEKAIGGLRQTGGFSEPELWTFEWQRSYTTEQWLDELPTSGLLTRLPADRLARLLAGIGTAIDTVVNGSLIAHYSTLAVTARRVTT